MPIFEALKFLNLFFFSSLKILFSVFSLLEFLIKRFYYSSDDENMDDDQLEPTVFKFNSSKNSILNTL